MRNIVVVPYCERWTDDFDAESGRVREALAPLRVVIHHIGSTSVPGLAAKPVIDMLLVVESPEAREGLAVLDDSNPAMTSLGYDPKGEFGIPGRRFFSKGGDASRTHHMHAFARGHDEIRRHLAFRDYLRAHPDAAARYARLKIDLARRYPNDIESYVAGKSGFIAEILADAERWQSDAPDAMA